MILIPAYNVVFHIKQFVDTVATKSSKQLQKLAAKARLRRRLREHFRRLGYSKGPDGLLSLCDTSKATIRATHATQRNALLRAESVFIRWAWSQVGRYFASGVDVRVDNISPRLELVNSGSWQAMLFRLATLTWSIPVSQGYGRRMRFLVWDDRASKLIGVFALGDPVFNLRVRDQWIGWDGELRSKRLVNVMDAYVVGAVPPYARLLGGKLVASLIRSKDVVQIFDQRYGKREGIISHEKKHPSLALVTTSSALGRSSLYNRLVLDGSPLFSSLGFTQGWGHFHISDGLFDLMRSYLALHDHPYTSGFEYGAGSNWKLRVAKAALKIAGIRTDTLKHGIKRELFACPMAVNTIDYLCGNDPTPVWNLLPSVEVGRAAVSRWMIPRAQRVDDWMSWRAKDTQMLFRPDPAATSKSA